MTQPGEVRIRRAVLSVSDKTGIVEFADGLAGLGIELVSTGGTAQALEAAGLEVRAIDDFTGFPGIMSGRVKTLHPKLYAGLLARRDDPSHMVAAEENEIEFVDLVCVNLYPFEETAARRGVDDEEVIENIDIGGPTMIRAAAKNHQFAAVVVTPESYDAVLEELKMTDGLLSENTREALALDAFAYTARYDAGIARWFAEREDDFPTLYPRVYEKVLDLTYGENPHQRAAYYAAAGARTHLLSMVSKLHGKELSFNNLLDLDSARRLVEEFELPAAVIIKHNNPCGCAVGGSLIEAYQKALATDPVSAYGGVYVLNRRVDRALAEELSKIFVELVFAPGYDDDALDVLSQKPNVRILNDAERRDEPIGEHDTRRVRGGLLVQDRNADVEFREDIFFFNDTATTEKEWGDLLFSWKVCKHVRSNAIVLSKELATAGIGAGQMSRVDSVRIAVDKARVPLDGAAMASDAFFPFADGPQVAIEAGLTSIIQPGGSKRDQEVVDACDEAGVAMVFTTRRHFRH